MDPTEKQQNECKVQKLIFTMNKITYKWITMLNDIKTIDVPEKDLLKCSVQRGDGRFNRTNCKELEGKTVFITEMK